MATGDPGHNPHAFTAHERVHGPRGKAKAIKTRHVTCVTVIDPDSKLPVEVEIRKLETGAMVGIDGSFLEQDAGLVYSPYDKGQRLSIPDDEVSDDLGTAAQAAAEFRAEGLDYHASKMRD